MREEHGQFEDRADESDTLRGIERGLADVEAGRVTPLAEFAEEVRRKQGLADSNGTEIEREHWQASGIRG
jgi:predicted transcriptional regulator